MFFCLIFLLLNFLSIVLFLRLLLMELFFHFFLNCSLLVYKNATDFCMLMLNSISCGSNLLASVFFLFLWIFCVKDFVICKKMPRCQFYFFYSRMDNFISFSYLIALVRNFSTMLNTSSKSWHPCLVPDLKGKAFIPSPLSMMLDMNFS